MVKTVTHMFLISPDISNKLHYETLQIVKHKTDLTSWMCLGYSILDKKFMKTITTTIIIIIHCYIRPH